MHETMLISGSFLFVLSLCMIQFLKGKKRSGWEDFTYMMYHVFFAFSIIILFIAVYTLEPNYPTQEQAVSICIYSEMEFKSINGNTAICFKEGEKIRLECEFEININKNSFSIRNCEIIRYYIIQGNASDINTAGNYYVEVNIEFPEQNYTPDSNDLGEDNLNIFGRMRRGLIAL